MTTLTERGQVSMPAAVRKRLHLMPGQPLMWDIVADSECRVVVVRHSDTRPGKSMRGFMKAFQKGMPRTTSGWLKLLREGEKA